MTWRWGLPVLWRHERNTDFSTGSTSLDFVVKGSWLMGCNSWHPTKGPTTCDCPPRRGETMGTPQGRQTRLGGGTGGLRKIYSTVEATRLDVTTPSASLPPSLSFHHFLWTHGHIGTCCVSLRGHTYFPAPGAHLLWLRWQACKAMSANVLCKLLSPQRNTEK